MSEFEHDMREAVRDLSALMNSAADQARAMTDAELGELLLSGRWSTIEIHEAGLRLKRRAGLPAVQKEEAE